MYISHIKTTTSNEVMKTYMISYTQNGQEVRDTKTTSLNPKQVKKHYEGLGCVNAKVRVIG